MWLANLEMLKFQNDEQILARWQSWFWNLGSKATELPNDKQFKGSIPYLTLKFLNY